MQAEREDHVIATQCPTCRTRVVYEGPGKDEFFPFCSERCKLVDLGKWFDEEHRIPPEPEEQEEQEEQD